MDDTGFLLLGMLITAFLILILRDDVVRIYWASG